jgi:DNA-binding transcriptional LysR family regulator
MSKLDLPPETALRSVAAHGSPSAGDLLPAGRLIEYWCAVAVAEELHFTRAARRLHVDQPALSRHIQKLESALGVSVFIRGERKIELTEAGKAFIPFAKKALLAAGAGVRIAQAISRGEPQEFEVAYSTIVDTHLIAAIKVLVEDARPPIPVRFRSCLHDELMKRLFDGASHAAIVLLPIEHDVAAASILREEIFLVVSDAHALASRSHVSVNEIADAPVVWPIGVMPGAFTKELFARFRKAGYVPNVTHEAQTTAESLGLVREGLGITFVKTSDRVLAGDSLQTISVAPAIPIETGLVHMRERRWGFLSSFVELVTNHFQPKWSIPKVTSGSRFGGA